MARWVDVRVVSEDEARARAAILKQFAPVDIVIDTRPPQATSIHADGHPNEAELRVCDHSEDEVRNLLRSLGISVLAIRTRIGERLHRP